MSTATLLLGVVIAILFGSLFHLWRGGKAGRLVLYLFFSTAGLWSGHFIEAALNWDFDKLWQLHLAFGIQGSLLFILIGNWLSRIDKIQGTK